MKAAAYAVSSGICSATGALRLDRITDAADFASCALDLAREHNERGHQAWVLRILAAVTAHFGLGELRRRTGSRQEAREHLTTATTMYREMDMRFWWGTGGGRDGGIERTDQVMEGHR
jgi:hypothetical protein